MAVKRKKPSVPAPAFLNRRQWKKIAEQTRRERISAALTRRPAVPKSARKKAVETDAVDLDAGFDPSTDD